MTPSDSTKTQKSVYGTSRSEPGPRGAQHWEMDGLERGEKCTQIQGPGNKVTRGTKASSRLVWLETGKTVGSSQLTNEQPTVSRSMGFILKASRSQ